MSDELDVEQLREELETIKDAMGIQERYASALHLWLVYGVLVGLAAVGSQTVELLDLPPWGHAVSWVVFMSLGSVYQYVALDDESGGETAGGKPDIALQYLAVFSYVVVVLIAVSPQFSGDATAISGTIFAVIVGGVGLAYLLAGNALKAYYIRRRDRFAFYVGGAWMLLLAVLIAWIPVLQKWGYAVFGIAFGLHAVASYVLLRD